VFPLYAGKLLAQILSLVFNNSNSSSVVRVAGITLTEILFEACNTGCGVLLLLKDLRDTILPLL
jgi:hypothetical protein